MEQNKITKQVKMSSPSTSPVKPLNVAVYVKQSDKGSEVSVTLINPETLKEVITELFPMLPNVPLETYVQYTFGKYNAFCSNKTENA